jgi:hypothetical protein
MRQAKTRNTGDIVDDGQKPAMSLRQESSGKEEVSVRKWPSASRGIVADREG